MIIAQITDMHVKAPGVAAFGAVDTGARLAACVDRILRLAPRPDVVVATGDLVDAGTPEEYAHLEALLAPLPMPVYLIPGNHDEREALRAAFAGQAYMPHRGAFLQYVVDDHPVRLVALDTVVPGEPGGNLCDARLEWLARRLEEAPERPTIILMHHPPFETGIVHMDGMNCANAQALGRLVARHPQVERILCGHVHRPVQMRWYGTVASIGPSPAFQVALDLEPAAPAQWVDEPPPSSFTSGARAPAW